jgi:hypothetical protein
MMAAVRPSAVEMCLTMILADVLRLLQIQQGSVPENAACDP